MPIRSQQNVNPSKCRRVLSRLLNWFEESAWFLSSFSGCIETTAHKGTQYRAASFCYGSSRRKNPAAATSRLSDCDARNLDGVGTSISEVPFACRWLIHLCQLFLSSRLASPIGPAAHDFSARNTTGHVDNGAADSCWLKPGCGADLRAIGVCANQSPTAAGVALLFLPWKHRCGKGWSTPEHQKIHADRWRIRPGDCSR